MVDCQQQTADATADHADASGRLKVVERVPTSPRIAARSTTNPLLQESTVRDYVQTLKQLVKKNAGRKSVATQQQACEPRRDPQNTSGRGINGQDENSMHRPGLTQWNTKQRSISNPQLPMTKAQTWISSRIPRNTSGSRVFDLDCSDVEVLPDGTLFSRTARAELTAVSEVQEWTQPQPQSWRHSGILRFHTQTPTSNVIERLLSDGDSTPQSWKHDQFKDLHKDEILTCEEEYALAPCQQFYSSDEVKQASQSLYMRVLPSDQGARSDMAKNCERAYDTTPSMFTKFNRENLPAHCRVSSEVTAISPGNHENYSIIDSFLDLCDPDTSNFTTSDISHALESPKASTNNRLFAGNCAKEIADFTNFSKLLEADIKQEPTLLKEYSPSVRESPLDSHSDEVFDRVQRAVSYPHTPPTSAFDQQHSSLILPFEMPPEEGTGRKRLPSAPESRKRVAPDDDKTKPPPKKVIKKQTDAKLPASRKATPKKLTLQKATVSPTVETDESLVSTSDQQEKVIKKHHDDGMADQSATSNPTPVSTKSKSLAPDTTGAKLILNRAQDIRLQLPGPGAPSPIVRGQVGTIADRRAHSRHNNHLSMTSTTSPISSTAILHSQISSISNSPLMTPKNEFPSPLNTTTSTQRVQQPTFTPSVATHLPAYSPSRSEAQIKMPSGIQYGLMGNHAGLNESTTAITQNLAQQKQAYLNHLMSQGMLPMNNQRNVIGEQQHKSTQSVILGHQGIRKGETKVPDQHLDHHGISRTFNQDLASASDITTSESQNNMMGNANLRQPQPLRRVNVEEVNLYTHIPQSHTATNKQNAPSCQVPPDFLKLPVQFRAPLQGTPGLAQASPVAATSTVKPSSTRISFHESGRPFGFSGYAGQAGITTDLSATNLAGDRWPGYYRTVACEDGQLYTFTDEELDYLLQNATVSTNSVTGSNIEDIVGANKADASNQAALPDFALFDYPVADFDLSDLGQFEQEMSTLEPGDIFGNRNSAL